MCNDAKINQIKSIFLLEFNASNMDALNMYDDRNRTWSSEVEKHVAMCITIEIKSNQYLLYELAKCLPMNFVGVQMRVHSLARSLSELYLHKSCCVYDNTSFN